MSLYFLAELWPEEKVLEAVDGDPLQKGCIILLRVGVPHRATKSTPGAGSLLGIHSQWSVNMDCYVYILHLTVEIKKNMLETLSFE